jgi:hypothetical protein
MKVRTIKELLELMLQHQDKFENGLCHWVYKLELYYLITADEYGLLIKYIKNNRPSLFSSLDAFKQWFYLEAFYWEDGKIEPRLEWINKHIKLNG